MSETKRDTGKGDYKMSGVKLTDIVEKMNLKNLTPEVDITEREVLVPDVNRPALQLAGFFDHFDLNRVQIIGNVECAYLETLEEEKRVEIYQKLLEHKVPCIIFSNELQPDESFIEIAQKNDIPVLALRDAKNKYLEAVFIICTEDYMTAESVEQKTRDGMIDNLKKENAYSVESEIRLKHYVFLLDIKRSCKDIVLNKENKQDSFLWQDFRKIILFNNMSNSGSYYMEQLLDGHTDILFLPYSGSFKMVYDKRLASLQNEELIVEIMAQMLGYFHSRYESFDCVGQHRYQKFILDEYGNCMNDILIDPEEYMVCLLQQFGGEIKLKSYGHLIKILFAAYNNALHRKKEEKDYWIFYHMHTPNADAQKLMGDFEKDEFDRMESLMIIREPVQHLYSWIRRFVKIEKNVRAVRKPMLEAILKSELGDMLEIKNIESTYAICFEDLKYRTADTMKSLCKWLDIPYQDQLLETTIQGKQVYFPANTAEGIKYITGNDTSTVRLTCFREVLSLWDETRLNIIYGEFKKACRYVCKNYL